MTFSDFKAHSNPIFKELKILKVEDSIHVLNCLFVHDYFNNKLPKPFISSFNNVSDLHSLSTRRAANGCLVIASCNSTKYGLKSINRLCIDSWNNITKAQKIIDEVKIKADNEQAPIDLYNISKSKLKKILNDYFLDSY